MNTASAATAREALDAIVDDCLNLLMTAAAYRLLGENFDASVATRLDVVPRDVVYAVGGDESSDAGVGSVVIVEVEPVGVGRGACCV